MRGYYPPFAVLPREFLELARGVVNLGEPRLAEDSYPYPMPLIDALSSTVARSELLPRTVRMLSQGTGSPKCTSSRLSPAETQQMC
jgi:hypothetical protein